MCKKNIAGPQIRHYRRMRELTQTQLSARLAEYGIIISASGISQMERCQRFIWHPQLAVLSDILQVSVERLLTPRAHSAGLSRGRQAAE